MAIVKIHGAHGDDLELSLGYVALVEEDEGWLMSSEKILLHLVDPSQSGQTLVRLAFKQGGRRAFAEKLFEALRQRRWEVKVETLSNRPRLATLTRHLSVPDYPTSSQTPEGDAVWHRRHRKGHGAKIEADRFENIQGLSRLGPVDGHGQAHGGSCQVNFHQH